MHVLCILIGILVLALGCGKNDPTVSPTTAASTPAPAPAPAPACASGKLNVGGSTCLPGTFQEVCVQIGGTILSTNPQTCKLQRNLTYRNPYFTYGYYLGSRPDEVYVTSITGGIFPRLNKTDPAGPLAYHTGIPVRKGDRLDYEGLGDWGGRWKSGFLGLSGSGTFYSCEDKVDIDGTKSGSEPRTALPNYQDLPPALAASDGTEVFVLGRNLQNKTIQNDGTLRVGFNTSPFSGSCGDARIRYLTITHCEDVAGVTYPCP